MKIKMPYLTYLGSFLDENNIDWKDLTNHDNPSAENIIEFKVKDGKEAFELGVKYQQFVEKCGE